MFLTKLPVHCYMPEEALVIQQQQNTDCWRCGGESQTWADSALILFTQTSAL